MPRTSLRSASRPLFALAAVLAAFAFPAAAQALEFKIVNESGRSDEDVYVTVIGGDFDVTGMKAEEPKPLNEVPDPLEINSLNSGRIYFSYDTPIHESELGELFVSPTRFDWVELTVEGTGGNAGSANLTAIEQFGIGTRLETLNAGDGVVEELGSANSDTVFEALQGIPGGPAATVRDGAGDIVRVLAPKITPSYPAYADVYPDLGDYVRSMAGKSITLHSSFSGPVSGYFASSLYTGTFAADGSITLNGTYERNSSAPEATAPAQIPIPGDELIGDIYTGGNTPNNLEGQIRHDLLVGFMAGYWDGRYGNDAIGFCTDPTLGVAQPFCPTGFNQLAYGDARPSLSPFATCEQYAAVINQYTDEYGNPYSDATSKVAVSLDESSGVKALQLRIQPDSGDAQPVSGGNSNCGAGPSVVPAPSGGSSVVPIRKHKSAVQAKLFKRAKLRRGKLRVARVACASACGRIRAVVRKGKRVLARALVKRAGRKRLVVAHLTKPGRKLLRHRRKLKVRLDLWVAPKGKRVTHRHRKLLLIR